LKLVQYTVSNPWREAIEVERKRTKTGVKQLVSNPWREAIEARRRNKHRTGGFCFQSLEGGY